MIKPILIIALASLAPFVKASHYIPLSSECSINGGTLYESKKSKKTSFFSWLLPKKEIPKLNNIAKPYIEIERMKEKESKEYYFVEAQIHGLSKEKIKEHDPVFSLTLSPMYGGIRYERVNILCKDECYYNLAKLIKRGKFPYLLLEEKTKSYYYYALKIKKERKVNNRLLFAMTSKKDHKTQMCRQIALKK